jgi:Na+-translocating ferredoxin:NAD+ oxidoreductase RnfC subunit
LVEQVRQAGVVGAGGAGFPTYVKLKASVDTYIANAAECEPLLYKDQELMRTEAERMVRGLRLGMEATGATRGVIAIKAKYKDAIAALGPHMGSDLEFYYFESFYPAGDEYIVVYDVTGRLIPVPGIPLDVGCVVNNVETLINMANAAEGRPVTRTTITVAGAVREPASVTVPVGVTAREVVELVGGSTVPDVALLDGGAMMGKLVGLDAIVNKASGGYIVLPREHHLVRRRSRTDEAKVSIARSACDQCSYCTEFCPRFLLGYAIEPHKVMRSVGFAGEAEAGWARLGLQCCECNLCSLYACPEDLPVMEMCVRSKQIWRQIEPRPDPLPPVGRAHPMRDHRRVPISRLVHRLGLVPWDVHAPLVDRTLSPEAVQLNLSQHIGAPAVPVVSVGDKVSEGQLVAAIPEGKLGATVHASISGRVASIDDTAIYIQR